MKSLVESLFDKKGTLDRDVYKYHPRTKKELINCIRTEIDLQGPNADLNIIDTRAITTMNWLFKDFSVDDIQNINISLWKVDNVENMNSMFYSCKKFNCDLSNWNVSKVQDMRQMFWSCDKFNSDLSRWNVDKVQDMNYMFFGCEKFNCDLSRWDVSNVESMIGVFNGCESLKKIPSWYKK